MRLSSFFLSSSIAAGTPPYSMICFLILVADSKLMFLLETLLLLLWMLLLLIVLSLPVSSLVYVFELLTFKGLNLLEIEHLLLEKFKLAVAAFAVSEKLLGSACDSKTIDTVPFSF